VNDFPKILYHYEFSCLNPGITWGEHGKWDIEW
jgi:hypothetical protein